MGNGPAVVALSNNGSLSNVGCDYCCCSGTAEIDGKRKGSEMRETEFRALVNLFEYHMTQRHSSTRLAEIANKVEDELAAWGILMPTYPVPSYPTRVGEPMGEIIDG